MLFAVPKLKRQNFESLLNNLGPRPGPTKKLEDLKDVIVLGGHRNGFLDYNGVKTRGTQVSDVELQTARSLVRCEDVCKLQYTSGSTGQPKAAMLTHL